MSSKATKKLKWEPAAWKIQYENIKKMRETRVAPVDSLGCSSISDTLITPKEKRLSILLSLMLSSQTKDEITAKAMRNIHNRIKPFTVENLMSIPQADLEKLIYPAGFYRTKARHIQRTAKVLKEEYQGDIPDKVDELRKLPGVGPKMAYICMSAAWNNTVGIGVDTHVHRIANRLEWTRAPTKIPDKTRKELEEWLPSEYWNEINLLFVGFGQTICKPVRPTCSLCLNSEICAFKIKNSK